MFDVIVKEMIGNQSMVMYIVVRNVLLAVSNYLQWRGVMQSNADANNKKTWNHVIARSMC